MTPSGKKRLEIGVARIAQLGRRPLEDYFTVPEHQELRVVLIVKRRLLELHLALAVDRTMRRDVERIPELMGYDNRRHLLEIAQLDDLVVDGQRRDRVQAGCRLIIENDL